MGKDPEDLVTVQGVGAWERPVGEAAPPGGQSDETDGVSVLYVVVGKGSLIKWAVEGALL